MTAAALTPKVDVRRAADRFTTRIDWLDSKHSFSFGRPDEDGIAPGYEQLEIDGELLAGGLVPVASGMPQHDGAAAIRIRNRYAALYAARLQPGQSVQLPEAPFVHLFVARGAVTIERAGR